MTDSDKSETLTQNLIIGSGTQETDTIDAVRNLLKAVGIGRVIIVDDEFEPSESDLLAVGGSVGSRAINVAGIGEVDFSNEPELWRGQLSDAWLTLGFTDKRRALEDLCEQSSTPAPKPEELHLFYGLGPEIDFRGITPEEWVAEKNSVISRAAVNPTLVLFDRDFGSTDSDGGLRLAAELYDEDDAGHIWAGLLTNTLEIADEGSAWNSFTDGRTVPADRFVVLSKEHLIEDANSLPEALRISLISKPASTLSKHVKSAIASSVESAAQRLSELKPPEFERIVFGLARDEGAWEIDVLLRLFDVSLRLNVRNELHSDGSVRSAIKMLRELDSYRGESNPVSVQAQQIYQEELYENPEHINRLHLPVELGDIYQKIVGEKKFVLVGQPCDLMVRRDGKRAPELSFVTLLPIRLDDPNSAQTDAKAHRASFELPAFKDGRSAWVEMDRPCSVPVESVDYCALNESGRGLAPTRARQPEWIVPSWEQRWRMLTAAADELRTALASKANKEERIAEIKAQYGIRSECKAKPDIEDNNYNLGLIRTGRIRSPYARALLTSYTAHLARDAYEPAIA